VSIATGTEDPAAVAVIGIWLGVKDTSVVTINGVKRHVFRVNVENCIAENPHSGELLAPQFTLVIAQVGVLGELLNAPNELTRGEIFISGVWT